MRSVSVPRAVSMTIGMSERARIAADVAAVAVGQVRSSSTRSGSIALGELERPGGGAPRRRLEALARERLRERLGDRGLVLDEQDAGSPGSAMRRNGRARARLCPGFNPRWRALGGPSRCCPPEAISPSDRHRRHRRRPRRPRRGGARLGQRRATRPRCSARTTSRPPRSDRDRPPDRHRRATTARRSSGRRPAAAARARAAAATATAAGPRDADHRAAARARRRATTMAARPDVDDDGGGDDDRRAATTTAATAAARRRRRRRRRRRPRATTPRRRRRSGRRRRRRPAPGRRPVPCRRRAFLARSPSSPVQVRGRARPGARARPAARAQARRAGRRAADRRRVVVHQRPAPGAPASPPRRRGPPSAAPAPAPAAPRPPGARSPAPRRLPPPRSAHDTSWPSPHGHRRAAARADPPRSRRRRAPGSSRSPRACPASTRPASCARSSRPARGRPGLAAAARAVRAALRRRRTGGLVDPTLLGALERAGYTPPAGARRAPLADALAAAPARRAARPRRALARRGVDDAAGTIAPPARPAARPRRQRARASPPTAPRAGSRRRPFAVDCGGDMRVGGAPRRRACAPVHRRDRSRRRRDGAIATSGIDRRAWRRRRRRLRAPPPRPPTGAPAWTGLVSVTALAPTALEAETLAKAALLTGPRARGSAAPRRRRARPRRRPSELGGPAGDAPDRGGMTPDPLHYGWWLARRASGVVALALVTLSVGVGLAMAGGVSRARAARSAAGAPRARRARRAGRDRRPRRHAARRPVAAPRAGRRRRCRSHGLPAALHRRWASSPATSPRCSGLSFYARRRIGARLLAQGCTARRCSSTPVRGPRPRRRHGRGTPWLRGRVRSPARRSCSCS